jgi:hypothetical protein
MPDESIRTVEAFAARHRLHTRLDECGDKIIPGRPGRRDGTKCDRQLYFDGGELCLMILDGAPVVRRRWEALGGQLWLGDISQDSTGKRVQDVKVTGIAAAQAKLAIRLARAKPRRVMSPAQAAASAAALAKAHARPGESDASR